MTDLIVPRSPRSLRPLRSIVSPLALGMLGLLFACGDDGNAGTGGIGGSGLSSNGGSEAGTSGSGASGGSTSQGGSSSAKGGSGGTSSKGGGGGSTSKGGSGGTSSKGGSGGTSSKGGNGGSGGSAGAGAKGGSAGSNAGSGGFSNPGGSGGSGQSGAGGTGAGGKSGANPSPIWSFTTGKNGDNTGAIDPSTLVTSDDRVYVASYAYPVRVTALDGGGAEIFSTDIADAAGVEPNSPTVAAALAVAHDDTLVVVLRNYGKVVRLDAQGKVRWTASNPSSFSGSGGFSAPAIAKDGTVYVTQSYGASSNNSLPKLLAIAPNGDVKFIFVTTNAERDGSFALEATPPHLLPDGRVRLIVGNFVRTYTPGTLALSEEHTLASAKPYAVYGGFIVPKLDGGFASSVHDTSQTVPLCESTGYPTFGQAHDATGGLSWTTALPSTQQLLAPTTDKGGALLYPWGNCYDGEGEGTYRVGADGKLLGAFALGGGDALQSFGTSGNEILTLQQTRVIDGIDVSPVVVAADRETGAITRRFALACATGTDTASEDGAFRVLPSGRLIVTCEPRESAPGKGGVYAFDTDFKAPADSAWPYNDGDMRSRRSFETGAAGSGSGGSGSGGSGAGGSGAGGSGAGGSGAGGSGQAGTGGGGAAGSSSGGIPTDCSQTNQSQGCCSADGNTLYYCAAGSVVKSQTCLNADCGWNDAEGYYDCNTDGLEAPGAAPPLACGL